MGKRIERRGEENFVARRDKIVEDRGLKIVEDGGWKIEGDGET
jgi:hypothetical protein